MLVALQHPAAAGVGEQARAVFLNVLGPRLGLGVAEPPAVEDLGEEELPLLGGALAAQHVHVDEVALRDLRDVGVSGREEPHHLGQGTGAHVGPAVVAGDGYGEQAALRELVQFGGRQAALPVALGGTGGEPLRQPRGGRDRFRVARDDLRHDPSSGVRTAVGRARRLRL